MSDKLIKQGLAGSLFGNLACNESLQLVCEQGGDCTRAGTEIARFRTRTGAVICIGYSAAFANGFMDGGDRVHIEVMSHVDSTGFVLTVHGGLSRDERELLVELLQQIEVVTEQYYSSQIQDAFRKAISLGFDGRQLACYSLGIPADVNPGLCFTQSRSSESLPAWNAAALCGQEVGSGVRLGDAIKHVRKLGDLMNHESGGIIFDRAGWVIGSLLKKTMDAKAGTREEGQVLAHLALDISNTLIMMHDA